MKVPPGITYYGTNPRLHTRVLWYKVQSEFIFPATSLLAKLQILNHLLQCTKIKQSRKPVLTIKQSFNIGTRFVLNWKTKMRDLMTALPPNKLSCAINYHTY